VKVAWREEPLGAVCQFINRGISPAYLESGGVAVLNQKCVRDHAVNFDLGRRHNAVVKKVPPERYLRAGDVLVNSTGTGTLGRVAQIRANPPEPTTVDSHVTLVRPAEGVFCAEFFGYALVAIERQIQEGGEGCGGQTELSRSKLAETYRIRFPVDLQTQRHIVRILDEAFEGIASAKVNAERNLQNARELFASRMHVLFGQEEAWERVPLAELMARGWITSHLDGNHGSDYPRKEEFVDAGVPYIAASAINGGAVDFGEAKYLSPERASSIRKGLAKHRDVLFAHNATVGPVAILSTAEDFVILGTSLTYYRCDPQHIHPEYLAHFMLSPAFTSQYAQVMKQSTRNQVPITKQRELFHVIPPIDVQKRIADGLDDLSTQTERLADLEVRKLAAFDELKNSLLRQAFAGHL
jgi:type I restriction enzyme S subunit